MDGPGFASRAKRLHPDLAYQVDPEDERVTPERAAVLDRLDGRHRVLEVGCASGWFSSLLVQHGHEVVGLEGDPRAAERARQRGIEIIEGDAEAVETWTACGDGFDAVVCMHVLEHLADPWEALRRAAQRLAPGGRIVSLLPNVAAWRIRRSLFFKGEFEYQDTGILDRTHLRFFTIDSGLHLHRAAGLDVIDWAPVDTRAPFEPLVRYRLGLAGPGARYGRVMVERFPNLCTEVFLVEAAAQ